MAWDAQESRLVVVASGPEDHVYLDRIDPATGERDRWLLGTEWNDASITVHSGSYVLLISEDKKQYLRKIDRFLLPEEPQHATLETSYPGSDG